MDDRIAVSDRLNAIIDLSYREPSSPLAQRNRDAFLDLQQEGENVVSQPEKFPTGLPDIHSIRHPRQLGPFFEGMLPDRWPRDQDIGTRIEHLNPLMNDAWLNAAAECGAYDLYFLTLSHRGQLSKQLQSYQESGNEIDLIRFGETLGKLAAPIHQINPDAFSTKTLALILAGAIGIHDSTADQQIILVNAALDWTKAHKDLIPMLKDFRASPLNFLFLDVMKLWRDGEYASAFKRLTPNERFRDWDMAQLVNFLLLHSQLSDDEIRALIPLLPSKLPPLCFRQLDDKEPNSQQARLAKLMKPSSR